MKRKHAHYAGNALMVLGLVVMLAGIAFAVLNQLPQLQMPQLMIQGSILSIFIGALLWLVGARISGREKITDHYYWVRHYGDERCRRPSGNHHGHQ
ncbi:MULTISPECIES: stress-induced protein YchH [unclassified Erwinia]|uniref:stress-induced protein YchH n=1 Tax=unclassified Erwinia TaxID=2622719 RepID=UPI0008349B89|nr:stress-induced protein YchH [Erwinia sp. ErVv1]